MKKQFIVQKYVMAESVEEAIKKAKNLPVHEVFLHNSWFEKEKNFVFFDQSQDKIGFEKKK
jgi:hypothetical protein